jgi:hypothetical protein
MTRIVGYQGRGLSVLLCGAEHKPKLGQHGGIEALVPVAEGEPCDAGVRVGPRAAQHKVLPAGEEVCAELGVEGVCLEAWERQKGNKRASRCVCVGRRGGW